MIREYATFLSGDVKTETWIVMTDKSQVQQGDAFFSAFRCQAR